MIKKVILKQPAPPAEEIPVEVLAAEILSISEGIKKLRAGRLNERALLLLIQHAAPTVKQHGRFSGSPITAKQVKAVLTGLESLEREYLKPKVKP